MTLFKQAEAAEKAGDRERAEELCREHLAAHPRDALALGLLGLLCAQRGAWQEALGALDASIEADPHYPLIHMNRGAVLERFRRFEDSLASFDRALALAHAFPEAHYGRGMALRWLGRLEEAVAAYRDALNLKADYVAAAVAMGNALQLLHRPQEALAAYDRALAIQPDPQTHNNKGVLLKELGLFPEAQLHLQQALKLQPGYADAWNNLGIVLHARGQFENALTCYNNALRFNPEDAQCASNRGLTHARLWRYEQARADYDYALGLRQDLGGIWCNKGLLEQEMLLLDEAEQSFARGRQLPGSYVDATFNYSLLLLLQGRFAEGWPLFEQRWHKSDIGQVVQYQAPLWLGEENLAGKTILLHAEQGLGDTLQFCRYAALVKAKGAQVIMLVQKPLHGLLTGLAGVDQLVVAGDKATHLDFHTPLMSLPLALKTSPETIPAQVPYVRGDEAASAAWLKRLGPKQALRVGLAWSGNADHRNDHNRSIPAALLAALAQEGVEFHSLAKEIREDERAQVASYGWLRQHGEALNDFTDTAALMQQMDVIVSVDTSTAHLAGALGLKLWLLLPFAPDFRWLTGREDSPWYPTARLIRQQRPNSWPELLARVAAELAALKG